MIKSRRMKRAGYVARIGERRGVYRVLVGKPEGRRPLGRPRHRWNVNIEMVHQEVEEGAIDWIDPVENKDTWQDFVNTVMKLLVP